MQTKSPLLTDFDYSAWYATLSEEEKEEIAFRDLIKDKHLGVAHIYAKVLLRMVEKGGSKSVFMIQDFIENDPPPAYAIAFFAHMCVDKYKTKKARESANKGHDNKGGSRDIKRQVQELWRSEGKEKYKNNKSTFADYVGSDKCTIPVSRQKAYKYLMPKELLDES